MKKLIMFILLMITLEVSSGERVVLPEDFIGIEISRGLKTNLIPYTANKVVIK